MLVESSRTREHSSISVSHLQRVGLSHEQIRRIELLRDRYDPLIEQVETQDQWDQIQFMRWLYLHGYLPRG